VVVASDGTAVPELRRGLEKQREVATFRADVAALRIPGKDLDERWLADIAAKLSRAGADELADHATRARLGDMRSEAVRSWWAAEAPADPERVVGLLAEADAWKSPEARDECTSLARGTMGVWLRGRLSALPEGDRGVVALEEHLRQAAASIAKANASLGRSGFVNADQLVAGITAVADMASVVSGLQSIDGIPVAARKLDLDAIRQSRLAARFDVGEPEELDLSAVVDRLEAEAKALLEKRVPDACMAASEPGGTAAGSSLDGIETIARRLKHTLSKQAQDLVGLVRAATSQAIDTAVVGSRACACLAGGAAPARVDQIVGALAERLKTDGRIALLRSVAGCLPQGAGQGKDGRKDLLLGLARRALVADDLRSEDVGSVVEVLEGARLGKDDLQTLVRAAVTQRLDEAGSGDDAAMQAKSAAAAEVVRGFAMGPGTDEEQLRRMVHGACAGLAGEVVKALEQGNPGGDGAAAGGAKVLRAFSRALTPDGVGSDPYLIADALDELDRHRKLALDWGLKAVKCTGEGEEAAGNGPAIRLLLAEHELGLPDLQKHLSVEAFERLPGRDRLPFEWADGKLQPKARTPLARGLLCELNLSREQAAELADALGLRLPTKKEWQCAFECVDDRGGVRSRQDAKAGDANAARDALVRMKDVSRDGIIGLVLGVREWSSDGDLPLGGCYKDAETLDEKPEKPEGGMRPVGMRPVGMRLALDPVPPLLREIADAKP
jgi:hypothetical protein